MSIDEGTTDFKSFRLKTPWNPIGWLISKPYLHCEIVNGILIYQGPNSQNRPIPIPVYGQQDC